jgi:hypothetical protein
MNSQFAEILVRKIQEFGDFYSRRHEQSVSGQLLLV